MTLYTCDSCGTVREGDGQCYVCGGERLSETEIGGGEEYVCEECGESFGTQRGLNSHSRVHSDGEE